MAVSMASTLAARHTMEQRDIGSIEDSNPEAASLATEVINDSRPGTVEIVLAELTRKVGISESGSIRARNRLAPATVVGGHTFLLLLLLLFEEELLLLLLLF